MAVASQSTRFGRIYPPDEAWLAKATEEVRYRTDPADY